MFLSMIAQSVPRKRIYQVQGSTFIFLLILLNFRCVDIHNRNTEAKNKTKMNFEKAYEYCINYSASEGLDADRKLKVRNEDRFRFDFNSIDMSFNKHNSILIVRACIARLGPPKREDFISILDSLDKKYQDELAGGYLEFDETALEVDGYEPYRFNIRMDFIDADIEKEVFNKKVDDLLTAALKWRNKYYTSVFEELNKTWRENNSH